MPVAKGLLIQSRGPLGVIMIPEGRFIKVLLSGPNRSLGQEVYGRELRVPSLAGLLIAASVLLLIFIGAWSKMVSPAAAAYVALDINPSVELAVDKSGKVIKATGLDEDGTQLLAKVTTNRLDIYLAIRELVLEATDSNYINKTNNVVLVTVSPAEAEIEGVIDEGRLSASVKSSIIGSSVPVNVVVGRATSKERESAEKQGVSTGRYLIYKESSKKDNKVTVEDIKKKGLGQLEKENGVSIRELMKSPAATKGKEFSTPTKANNKSLDKEDKEDKDEESKVKSIEKLEKIPPDHTIKDKHRPKDLDLESYPGKLNDRADVKENKQGKQTGGNKAKDD